MNALSLKCVIPFFLSFPLVCIFVVTKIPTLSPQSLLPTDPPLLTQPPTPPLAYFSGLWSF